MHHLFGLEQVRYPVIARGEERWFFGYGVAAFVYRLLILFGIALFVSQKFFVIGVLLALFAVAMRVVVPLIRGVAFLLTSPRLGEKRIRAVATSAGLALGVAGVPVSLSRALADQRRGRRLAARGSRGAGAAQRDSCFACWWSRTPSSIPGIP